MTVGTTKRKLVPTVMKSNLRARGTRVSLKPSFVPATEAAQTRSSAQPCAPAVMTHVVSCRVARAPPPQVQMEEPSTRPSVVRPQSTSFHRARRGIAAACNSTQQRPGDARLALHVRPPGAVRVAAAADGRLGARLVLHAGRSERLPPTPGRLQYQCQAGTAVTTVVSDDFATITCGWLHGCRWW